MSKEESQGPIIAMSRFFTVNFRITLILLFGILISGFFVYKFLLPREGLPEIAFPLATIQTVYPVNDQSKVDEEVTRPIEAILAEISSIDSFSSNTGSTFSFVTVTFKTSITAEEGVKQLQERFKESLKLPAGIVADIKPIKLSSPDNKNDILYALYSTRSTSTDTLQSKGEEIAEVLSTSSDIKHASVTKLIDTIQSPNQQSPIETQVSFNRIGIKKNNTLQFYNSILIGAEREEKVSTVELSEAFNAKIDELKENEDLKGYELEPVVDLAVGINKDIANLEITAIQAMLAVVVVLFLFVSLRASIVTAIFIPATLAAVFISMLIFNISLNLISLFALILVLGLFVDDGIVVVEAIDFQKKQGKKGVQAVVAAIKSVGAADISGTLTTVIVFFPLLTISGILGEFIRQIPTMVILSLLLSLLIALTILPMLSNTFIQDKKRGRDLFIIRLLFRTFPNIIQQSGDSLSAIVRGYLSIPVIPVIIIILSLFIIGFGATFAGKLKFAIFPAQKDSDGITLSVVFNEGISVDEKLIASRKVEQILISDYAEYIEAVTYPNVQRSQSGIDNARIQIALTTVGSREKTSVQIVNELKEKTENISSDIEEITITAESAGGPPPSEYSYTLQIFGSNLTKSEELAADMQAFLMDLDLETDVEIVDTKIDNTQTLVKRNGKPYISLAVKLSDSANDGANAELDQKLQEEFSPSKLRSEYNLPADTLGFDRGINSDLFESFNGAIFATVVALILMYVLLVTQFNSFTKPLLILLAIPFSFVGLFPGLYITENALSFFVQIGVIALIGILVNNTIMLVDFANQAQKEGQDIRNSIANAIKIRYRPLLTTSTTTVVGLLPLALTDPLWESLAYTIIFGLISSTTMVILVFPAYYYVIEHMRHIAKRFIGGISNKIEA